jgi:hypothetical protein
VTVFCTPSLQLWRHRPIDDAAQSLLDGVTGKQTADYSIITHRKKFAGDRCHMCECNNYLTSCIDLWTFNLKPEMLTWGSFGYNCNIPHISLDVHLKLHTRVLILPESYTWQKELSVLLVFEAHENVYMLDLAVEYKYNIHAITLPHTRFTILKFRSCFPTKLIILKKQRGG